MHSSNLTGQRAKHGARRIDINYSIANDSSSRRTRGRRRSRDRQVSGRQGKYR